MVSISIIAAMSDNFVIGNNNTLPSWNIPGDLKRFKSITTGKVVIMGRKTYASIGKPLPNRENIIVSRSWLGKDTYEGTHIVGSLEEAIALAEQLKAGSEHMVIGGAQIYREALPYTSKMYLTELHEIWQGDTKFPAFDKSEWDVTNTDTHERFAFVDYQRKVDVK